MTARCLLATLAIGTILNAAERPNVIFILTDDQRQDSLPCYGNDFVKTPEIDKLAAQGVVFDNASVTSAICTPSRVCYFLGQYERRHGINFNSGTTMSPEAWEKSYPMIMRKAGYYTGYVGKNHVPIGAKGYETGLMDKSFDYWYAGHGHIKFYPKEVHEIFKHNPADTQVEVVTEGALSFLNNDGSYLEGALTFLDARPDGKPFCLSICLNVPHGSSTLTMEMRPTDAELYRTTYRDRMSEISPPPFFLEKKDIKQPKLPADVLYASKRQNIYDHSDEIGSLRELMVREYQTITGIDQMVGRLRTTLEERGLAENTVIVLSSDHGLLHGEHGLGGKALNYENCLAVPLIVHDPRLPKSRHGARVKELVQSIDLAPTLLDLAGLPVAESMQGESYLRLLRGEEAPDWRTFAFAENLWSTLFGNPRIESVRNSRWKYLRYFENDRSEWDKIPKKNQYVVTEYQRDLYAEWLTSSIKGEKPVHEELYDLENDPEEGENLVDRKEHQDVLEIMRKECQRMVAAAYGPLGNRPSTLPIPLSAPSR